ncbi:MAG: DUF1028 domain-containing protein [bacterium]
MTFSVVGRSEDGSAWGVAVASKFLAVGAVVPAAEAGVGAIATQAAANLRYRPDGLALLRSGHSAQETLDRLIAADDGRAERQAGVVDAAGEAATFTGPECMVWAGGRTAANMAVQGNILTGPDVVDRMVRSWQDVPSDRPLARRLLAALRAGDQAGGDRRGRQSAALLVVSPGAGYGGGSDVLVDLRVDDSADPCAELERLLDRHDLYFGRPAEGDLLRVTGEVGDRVSSALARLGYERLDDWVGTENYEMRVVDGRIDRAVLAVLEQQAADRG